MNNLHKKASFHMRHPLYKTVILIASGYNNESSGLWRAWKYPL